METSATRPETILGVDNVALELPVSALGSRTLAAFLDYLILFAVAAVLLVIFLVTAASLEELNPWLLVPVIFAFLLVHWLYFGLQEIFFEGRTVGKRAMGLRVVTRTGGTPGAGAFVLRTLVRDIDLLAGIAFMAIDPLSRRVGDRLAGTVVIHDGSADDEDEVVLSRLPRGWGPREMAVVEALLARADDLGAGRAEQLGLRVLAVVRRADPSFLPPENAHPPLTRLAAAFQAESA